MTREEAINALKMMNLRGAHPFLHWEEMMEVRDMAISALRQQDVADKHVWKNEPLTNAQKIRSMTDEELAEFLWDFNLADVSTGKMGEFGPHMFRYRLKEWLQMPAKEGKHEAD